MPQVEFDQSQYMPQTSFKEKRVPGLIGFLMRQGIAKNESQATLILIAVIIVCIGITIVTTLSLFVNSEPVNPERRISPEDLTRIIQQSSR